MIFSLAIFISDDGGVSVVHRYSYPVLVQNLGIIGEICNYQTALHPSVKPRIMSLQLGRGIFAVVHILQQQSVQSLQALRTSLSIL
jgi:hypothetical protein